MAGERKFSEEHPDPTGRERIPTVPYLGEIFVIYGGLVEASIAKRPVPERPDLPKIQIRPYIPGSQNKTPGPEAQA